MIDGRFDGRREKGHMNKQRKNGLFRCDSRREREITTIIKYFHLIWISGFQEFRPWKAGSDCFNEYKVELTKNIEDIER